MTIPPLIHQTWKTKDPSQWTMPVRRWVRSWERRNPDFRHRVSDDADCVAFVQDVFPEHADVYASLEPVEKADMWRYMMLFEHGGIYTDLDTVCRRPASEWLLPEDEIVIGLETDLLDKYPDWKPTHFVKSGGGYNPSFPWTDNVVAFCNWTIVSRPKHELFADVIRRVSINAQDPYFIEENPEWTIKKTGPGVFTDAVYDYVESLGDDPYRIARELRSKRDLRVGDIRFLDYDAFHTRFVKHVGMASWKPLHLVERLWRKARAMIS